MIYWCKNQNDKRTELEKSQYILLWTNFSILLCYLLFLFVLCYVLQCYYVIKHPVATSRSSLSACTHFSVLENVYCIMLVLIV